MQINFHFKTGEWYGTHYEHFNVGSASEGYPLTIRGFTGGDDTNWFTSHQLNRMKFSTSDNDNDAARGNCAAQWKIRW